MDKDLALITDLMNGLADARATLDACLAILATGDQPARKQTTDRLTQRIEDTVKEIDDTRLKALKHLIPAV